MLGEAANEAEIDCFGERGGPEGCPDGLYLVAIAVMASYEFIRDPQSPTHCPKLRAMIEHCSRKRSRSQRGYIHYRCLAVAYSVDTDHGHVIDEDLVMSGATAPVCALRLASSFATARFHVNKSQFPVEGAMELREITRTWEKSFGISQNMPMAIWHGEWSLARLIACDKWPGDIELISKKAISKRFFLLPGHPTKKACSDYCKSLGNQPSDSSSDDIPIVQTKQKFMAVRAFEPGHLIRAIRVMKDTKHQHNKDQFANHCTSVLDYLNPTSSNSTGQPPENNIEDPHYLTYLRGVVRFDVACMMMQRKFGAERPPSIYHLNFDASPQEGIETTGCIEETIDRDSVVGVAFADVNPDAIDVDTLALNCLGQGKSGLVDKTCALIHQRWCKHGPRISTLRDANKQTYTGLADMGVELAEGDMPDVVEYVINKKEIPRTLCMKVVLILQTGRQEYVSFGCRHTAEPLYHPSIGRTPQICCLMGSTLRR